MQELTISQCRQAIHNLQQMRPKQTEYTWHRHKSANEKMIAKSDLLDKHTISHFQTKLKMVSSAFNRLNEYIDENVKLFLSQIQKMETQALQDSLKWYVSKKLPQLREPSAIKPLNIHDEHMQILDIRMKIYCNWKYPGCCLFPRNGLYENMVSNDPLYLLDYEQSFLEDVKNTHNTTYRNRLRLYIMQVWHPKFTGRLLGTEKALPSKQFGFVFGAHFLNYLPMEGIQAVMHEVYDLLRPGGVAIFTYNNCEFPPTCRLFEQGKSPYTTWYDINKLLIKLEYNINYHYSVRGFDWFEVKKPGKLETIKGGQTMGRITQKPGIEEPKPKDRWNKQEILAIQQEAIDIGIDGPKEIKRAYSIDSLVKKIHNYKVQQAKLKADQNKMNELEKIKSERAKGDPFGRKE